MFPFVDEINLAGSLHLAFFGLFISLLSIWKTGVQSTDFQSDTFWFNKGPAIVGNLNT